MERYPAGIGAKGFIQKDVSKGFPAWLERVEVPKKDGTVHHPLVSDTRSLLWVTNQNSITPHVWTSRIPDLYQPDLCVFDLDPAAEDAERPPRRHTRASRPARGAWATELGEDLGLQGFPYRRATRRQEWISADVAGFAHAVGAIMVKRDPQHLTQEFHKVDRAGRILVDTGTQRLRRDLRGTVRGSGPHWCTGIRPVHVGRSRRRQGPARARSRSGTWRLVSRRLEICGPT